jgi:hypothetical protein
MINDHGPTWCEAVCIGIDAADAIMKQWRTESAAIAKAHHAFINEGDAETAVNILGDLVAKSSGSSRRNSDEIEKANPDQLRDWRGRFSGPGGAPGRAAASMATTAGRIANIARELEHALGALHHITSGQADIGRIVALGSALHGLAAELRELPSDLSHTARTSLHAAREAVARVRAMLRQHRGKRGIGKAAPVSTAITLPPNTRAVVAAQRLSKSEIARRDSIKQRLALIRGQLHARHSWQPMEGYRS